MTSRDDEFRIRPGRVRDGDARSFIGQVERAARKAAQGAQGFGAGRSGGGARFGRGRSAALARSLLSPSRRVIVKARVVRHRGARFRAAPLVTHIAYLEREGVTRDGTDARMFDANSNSADERAFAQRCEDDRHHFRLIISPEDAGEMADLRAFIDGRTHHLRFSDLELTGDAKPGAVVEARAYEDASGRKRLSLATRSDVTVEAQVSAAGATWIDRQLFSREPAISGGGFGAEVRDAMERRVDHLVREGLARRQGQRIVFARDLLDTLRRRELDAACAKLSNETGLPYNPSADGEHVLGVYRQRVTLASGRFAVIDTGLGFQLVPWRPALEQHVGRQVSGVIIAGGGVHWSFGRKRGLGL